MLAQIGVDFPYLRRGASPAEGHLPCGLPDRPDNQIFVRRLDGNDVEESDFRRPRVSDEYGAAVGQVELPIAKALKPATWSIWSRTPETHPDAQAYRNADTKKIASRPASVGRVDGEACTAFRKAGFSRQQRELSSYGLGCSDTCIYSETHKKKSRRTHGVTSWPIRL